MTKRDIYFEKELEVCFQNSLSQYDFPEKGSKLLIFESLSLKNTKLSSASDNTICSTAEVKYFILD